MVRIAGINLPDEKKIEVALTYVYGIGPSTSRKILKLLGIDPEIKTKQMSAADANKFVMK
jgi:small subunit ribosomal protein S13